MGQFKPMVKMMTDEPSVILKLKKGGKVAVKGGKDDGHKAMSGANPFAEAESGMAPKKPSMAERRRAMNPNMYAKGGKVVKKQMGGGMPMAMPGALAGANAPAPMPMQAMGRQALAGMAPAKRMKRAAMVQRALSGMKDGGSAECKALEKELKHHESMSASKAHGKAGGGKVSTYAKTKMDTAHKDRAHGTGEVKEGMPGGYAMGGSIMGNEKAYENTKMSTAGKGKTGGTTGGVKNGNGGGFKMGGRATKKAFATGGQVVDDGKAVKMPRHAISRPVANSLQSGTFAKGGKVDYYTDLAKRLQKNPEKPNLRLVKSHTGPKGHVAKVYKDRDYDEHRVKFFSPEGKHYSEADYHTDDLSDANDTAKGQLNRYKMGGKAKFAEGDSVQAIRKSAYDTRTPRLEEEEASKDMSRGAYDRWREIERQDNEALRNSILGAPKNAYEAIKGMFSSSKPPKGGITKTEKSVTVAPRKRGGSAMC